MPRPLAFLFLVLAVSHLPGQDFGAPEPSWTLAVPSEPVVPGQSFQVVATVRLPQGYYQDVESPFLSLETSSASVVARSHSAATIRKDRASFTGTFTLVRTVVLPAGTPSGPITLVWKAGWQICQVDGVCLLPSERTISLSVAVVGVVQPPWGIDVWGALLGAFLGGLLLNLMPCVFPVLALKAVGLVSASGISLSQRRREALAFASGGFGAVTGMGLVTAVLAGWGQRLDWGFSFQQPLFILGLALVFWVFALQLWGVWSWSGSPFTLTAPVRGGMGRAAVGGAFLVVAAAPCTAPLLGPALGFALAQPPALIPIFFAAVGLGLVAPVLILQAFPGWTRLLPRPGAWMVVLERVAGFFLAATVLYLSWVFTEQTAADKVWPLLGLWGVVALALAWAGRFPRSKLVRLFAVSLIAVGIVVLVLAATASNRTRSAEGWQSFSPSTLAEALADNRPVLIDATAAWCATCQVNELAVLGKADVKALFQRLDLVLLRADYTRPDPVIREWLKSVNRGGLPVYALYRPGYPLYLFPELLTDDNFTRVLESLPGLGT